MLEAGEGTWCKTVCICNSSACSALSSKFSSLRVWNCKVFFFS